MALKHTDTLGCTVDDPPLTYYLGHMKTQHQVLVRQWAHATRHVPCLGDVPNWPLPDQNTVGWVRMECEKLPAVDDGYSNIDESDAEDLIKPEPPTLLQSEHLALMDQEEEQFAIDSDSDDTDTES
jgi:hypothetical protein